MFIKYIVLCLAHDRFLINVKAADDIDQMMGIFRMNINQLSESRLLFYFMRSELEPYVCIFEINCFCVFRKNIVFLFGIKK